MTTSAWNDRLVAALRPTIEAAGLVLEDCGVARGDAPAGGAGQRLRVVVDLPSDRTESLDLDSLTSVTTSISDALDESNVMGRTPYDLEVSTPGVDRPLVEPRHFSRAVTRMVRVVLEPEPEAGTILGRLHVVDEGGIELAVDEGIKGRPKLVRHRLGWSAIASGRVEVEFKDRRSSSPDGAAGADADNGENS